MRKRDLLSSLKREMERRNRRREMRRRKRTIKRSSGVFFSGLLVGVILAKLGFSSRKKT